MCTVLYIAVAVVLTGIVPWQRLIDDAAPVVNSLKQLGATTGSHSLHWVRLVVLFGAMMGMISSLLVFQLGTGARVVCHVPRWSAAQAVRARASALRTPSICDMDCRIPGGDSRRHSRHRRWLDLSNIGTPFAFRAGVAGRHHLAYKQPERRRGFRAPRPDGSGAQRPVLRAADVRTAYSSPGSASSFGWGSGTVYLLYSRYRSEFCPEDRRR